MGATPQMFQKAAFKMEQGSTGAGQSLGWGDPDSAEVLGSGDAVPYLSLETNPEIATKEDESITSSAFAASPRLVGKTLSKPFTFYDRYYGLNRLYYWLMGFENEPKEVVVFNASATPWSASEPVPGTTFVQATNEYSYLRREPVRDTNGNITYIYIFLNDDSIAPSASGDLTLDGGSDTFTYTARSGTMYEHLYELNASGRRLRDYLAAEQITGYSSGDKLNLMATIGRRMSGYDQIIQNSICKNWSWKLSAGDLSQFETGFIGYDLKQGDYASANWTLPTGLTNNNSVPPSHETVFKIGSIFEGVGEDMVSLGLSEATLMCEMSPEEIQTYLSGVWLAEPIMGDKYKLSLTATIARHDGQTYENLRDNQTLVCAQIISNMGYHMREFLIKGALISNSGPDSSKVAQEPLQLGIGYIAQADNPFTDHLYGNTEIQSSPILARIRNESSINEMFAV